MVGCKPTFQVQLLDPWVYAGEMQNADKIMLAYAVSQVKVGGVGVGVGVVQMKFSLCA